MEEAFGNVVAGCHSHDGSCPPIRENEGLKEREHHLEEERGIRLEGTNSLGDDNVFSHAEDTCPVGGAIVVLGDSVIRNIGSRVCGGHNRLQHELPS